MQETAHIAVAMSGDPAGACEIFAAFRQRMPEHPFALVVSLYERALQGDTAAVRSSITPELQKMMAADQAVERCRREWTRQD